MRDVLPDEEVVRRVVAGEGELFELLIRRYNQRLFRVVRGRLRDDDEAEEAVQEAWVSAWRRLSTFSGRSVFAAWMTRIARRAAGQVALRRTRAEELARGASRERQDAAPGADPGGDEVREPRELRLLIERSLAALPETQRIVFALRVVEGLTTAEVAEALGLNESAVKVRLHRARRRLADELLQRARAAGVLERVWAFGGERCDRVVARVMLRLGLARASA
jgi:RNA polymerase sigma-70 factor (ECF subfamily)